MKVISIALLASLLSAGSANAQTPSGAASQPSGDAAATAAAEPAKPQATPAEATPIDPAKLPTSIGRIRLQLAMKPATQTSGLKLQELIEVVGVAPKVELWNQETAKLATGPVPWGAPTHKDFIDLVTPQEFKNYPFDLNALMQWLMAHLGDKKQTAE